MNTQGINIGAAVAALVERYRQPDITERDRALIERDIWEYMHGAVVRVHGVHARTPWLAGLLGQKAAAVSVRSRLLGHGSAADSLWERILLGTMTLRRAAEMAAEMRNTGASLASLLAAYDSLPCTRVLPNGQVVRATSSTRLPRSPAQQTAASAPSLVGKNTKVFWKSIRAQLAAHFAPRLEGLDPMATERVWTDFERELQVLVEGFTRKVKNLNMQRSGPGVTRRQVLDACEILGVDPPEPGAAIDLVEARKRQRAQAKVYHPDSNKGDHAMRAQFEAVNEAYQLLERYAEKHGTTGKGAHLSVIDGGKSEPPEPTQEAQ